MGFRSPLHLISQPSLAEQVVVVLGEAVGLISHKL
jgi:hypothetical protein